MECCPYFTSSSVSPKHLTKYLCSLKLISWILTSNWWYEEVKILRRSEVDSHEDPYPYKRLPQRDPTPLWAHRLKVTNSGLWGVGCTHTKSLWSSRAMGQTTIVYKACCTVLWRITSKWTKTLTICYFRHLLNTFSQASCELLKPDTSHCRMTWLHLWSLCKYFIMFITNELITWGTSKSLV